MNGVSIKKRDQLDSHPCNHIKLIKCVLRCNMEQKTQIENFQKYHFNQNADFHARKTIYL